MAKRKVDSTTEQQNCKDHEKHDRPYFGKWKLMIRVNSEIKVLPIDPVFSNWVNFNKKLSIINCSKKSKSFEAIRFFLRHLIVEGF